MCACVLRAHVSCARVHGAQVGTRFSRGEGRAGAYTLAWHTCSNTPWPRPMEVSGSVPAQPVAVLSYHGISGMMYAKRLVLPTGACANAGRPSARCRLVAESRSTAIGAPATYIRILCRVSITFFFVSCFSGELKSLCGFEYRENTFLEVSEIGAHTEREHVSDLGPTGNARGGERKWHRNGCRGRASCAAQDMGGTPRRQCKDLAQHPKK